MAKKAVKTNKVATQNNTKALLMNLSNQSNDVIFGQFFSSNKGITTEEQIIHNRNTFGANKISKKSKNSMLKRIIYAFINPFAIILLVLALISLVTDIIIPLSQSQKPEPVTMCIILIMVLISGILNIVNDTRSAASAEKLVKMVQTTTRVERNGIFYEIPLEEVVVGDIIILAAGDIIPADVKILSAKDLFVSQSSLTGESDAIEKFAKNTKEAANVTDLTNLAFMGSNVISGSARAIALATGNNTYLGQIAQKVNEKAVKTDFEKGIKAVSWLLIRIMLVVVPLVFVITGLRGDFKNGKTWFEALLFAISVAVGLTPEMLPMIVTSTLAKGAMSMSKKQTIVKNLNSIQNFGAMDVFCTDKTGTLTMDQVVLERHLDVKGQEDVNVLKHAFLNSHYQTGLKNLLDLSIISRTEELSYLHNELHELEEQYQKVDEIPFDFQRKRMSVVVKNKITGTSELIAKGAVEEILHICSHIEYDGQIQELSQTHIDNVLKHVDNLNDQGMRVIAIAKKDAAYKNDNFGINDETQMILIGYLAFLDPPKESTASAIKNLHELGVNVKILTGDNARVTKSICSKVGIPADKVMLGKDLLTLDDEALRAVVNEYDIYAKLSPDQKARIITALRHNGHVVGYMGDGINDAPAMKVADVSISVDTAVDIAKETASIILLEKDLNVLATGIIEGRKTYTNMNKYIKMTISSNFGNIISILFASLLLGFTPMLAVQILFLNLIYDLSCSVIPWDKVDRKFITKPRKWNSKSVLKFMLWFGPISSIIDITTFLLLKFVFLPYLYPHASQAEFQTLFRTGWFVLSMWTQALVIHFIRTEKIPFFQSKPAPMLMIMTACVLTIVVVAPYVPGVNATLQLQALHPYFYLMLFGLVALYITLVMFVKKLFIKRYTDLL
ncbi:magnesium-translocating P-type ATPase [Mycoplasmopsis columbinasalis]|uniref:Magnesium-transporting ATPase, P-type 1 n=1 Tax=Mycoplasmopsis columbinasalis TaxID=114880 RepID=A0A449BAK3_9BACT|nr:magnesium-translocating P-type ATPase [Mycoplasmopsis columbinasalis]VEU78231.1 Magnesium-transporting ATPase, P-type 1 [Mycoplasmopsis columbinasalis]